LEKVSLLAPLLALPLLMPVAPVMEALPHAYSPETAA
jgi:hypothetical protein